MKTAELRAGDVIDTPTGIHRTVERFVVHNIHRYDNGMLSVRARYASNPRGIDWSVVIQPDEPQLRLVSRGVAKVDVHTRSMLPQ